MAQTPPPRRSQQAAAAEWFYSHSQDGFALVRRGHVISANPAWCAMLGYTAEEVAGARILSLIHPDDQALHMIRSAELNENGQAEFESRMIRRDGGVIWTQAAVKKTEGGLYLVVMKDITEDKHRREEEAHTHKVQDLLRVAAGIYLWRFDPDTGSYTVEVDNSSGGHSDDQVSTGQMSDNIHPDDRVGFGKVFLPTVATGVPGHHSYRYRAPMPDGGFRWARFRTAWRGVRQCASGKWEIRGLTQDMTEVEEARDAALEAAASKSRFLANMSHEVRTPLNGVLGVLHLLKNECLSNDSRTLIDQALACGATLTELLNDVLDFSKIEAGKLTLNPEPTDVEAALTGVADILRPAAEARGLYLRARVQGAPGWVMLDAVRLRQMLFNLIGNATKFTLAGGVTIDLTSIGSGDDHRLRVEVCDTGVGVAPEAMKALFQRFQQADESTTRRFGGTGLGLAITRSLAEMMGGEIGAVSTVGEGSKFYFEVPAPQVAAPVAVGEADATWLEGLSVLVVEDNPTNRLIAQRMLESLGAVVETADDGVEGLDAARRQAFDLVFMDIQMPNMDGVEATRRIRRLGGHWASAPILALTANVMTHQVAEYLAAGMNGAIPKPLNPTEILKALARLSDADSAAAGQAA